MVLLQVHPKLPMRDAHLTCRFYVEKLGFSLLSDYGSYLILRRDAVELHFFEHKTLDPKQNYGQAYVRTNDVDLLHDSFRQKGVALQPREQPESKAWGQREFSLLDPDHNLLTFGQGT